MFVAVLVSSLFVLAGAIVSTIFIVKSSKENNLKSK